MKRRLLIPALLLGLAPLGVLAQDQLGIESAEDAGKALAEAEQQGAAARQRAEALEAQAASAAAEADKTAQEAAAMAARIQEAEAQVAANRARIGQIGQQRAGLRKELALRQRPLIQLTAALQRMSRRPAALSLLRPGSLREAVYLRAALETMLPEVERRTLGLRKAIERGRALEAQAQAASGQLRAAQGQFTQRRQALIALQSRQMLASRQASGIAARETDRARALAEQARDLSGLVEELGKQGELRAALAALPGPVLRPALPASAQVSDAAAAPSAPQAPGRFILPASGRLVAGFGDQLPGKPRSRGISLAANPSAQVVAPAAGRVAFAGPFQGYGNIVIIEHPGGWTSLVTGITELDTRVGAQLVTGTALGLAGPGRPVVSLEVRRGGEPVNPLDFVR